MERRLRLPQFSPFFDRHRFFDDIFYDSPSSYLANRSVSHPINDSLDVVDNEQEFSVSIDVSQFKPEELKVNIEDNQLIIEGHHEERKDSHGTVERKFVRKYTLPDGVEAEKVKSDLSESGVLCVKYEKMKPENKPKTIPIKIISNQKK